MATTISVLPTRIDLLLYRGDDFGPMRFSWSVAGVLQDISGYTITAQIKTTKDDTVALADFTVAIVGLNYWDISLTDVQTAALPASAFWDMQLKSGTFTRTYAAGKVKTSKDVTKPD